jgi:glutathione S-transferase
VLGKSDDLRCTRSGGVIYLGIYYIALIRIPKALSQLRLSTITFNPLSYSTRTSAMSSSIKPIKIYGKQGPNPPKVRMLAEELGLPYELNDVGFPDLKKPDYLAINPNGRMPAIHDPNNDLTLWESGAILEYLVEKYDTERKASFAPGSKESFLTKQWLFFQGTQNHGASFCDIPHTLTIYLQFPGRDLTTARESGSPNTIQRWYRVRVSVTTVGVHAQTECPTRTNFPTDEVKRVTSVLDGHLKKQEKGADGPWLVGGKFSYADLAFVPWQNAYDTYMAGAVDLSEFTTVAEWMERLKSRPAINKVLSEPPPTGH